jgi:hypothetical protein
MEAAWTVLPPEFLNVSCDTNQDVGGPFRHFGHFLVFNSFGGTFCLNDRHGLDLIRVVDQQFYFCQLFTALASVATNSGASVIARIGGGHGILGTLAGSAVQTAGWSQSSSKANLERIIGSAFFLFTESLYLEPY